MDRKPGTLYTYSVMIGLIATELCAGILEHEELGTELLYRSARLHMLAESNTGLLKCLQICALNDAGGGGGLMQKKQPTSKKNKKNKIKDKITKNAKILIGRKILL
jgi:hypothetical protein